LTAQFRDLTWNDSEYWNVTDTDVVAGKCYNTLLIVTISFWKKFFSVCQSLLFKQKSSKKLRAKKRYHLL